MHNVTPKIMPASQPKSCVAVSSSIASYEAEIYVDCAWHNRHINVAIGRDQSP